MNAPTVTFRDTSGNLLTSVSYIQSALGQAVLPVLQGETSDSIYFRIYNNYGLLSNISQIYNIAITTYDGLGSGSKTCAISPVSQSWIHVQMYGYGENSTTTPDRFTYFLGTETAIGGNAPCGSNSYTPEAGSNGAGNAGIIRPFSTNNGMGYIEFVSNAQLPQSGVATTSYAFAIETVYDWIT